MRTAFGNAEFTAREIGGRFEPGRDKIVKTLVGDVCKAIWKHDTDAFVGAICKCSPRNARRYMSGEIPIPAELLHAINGELLKRFE